MCSEEEKTYFRTSRQRRERNGGETFRPLRDFIRLRSETDEAPERVKRFSIIPFPSCLTFWNVLGAKRKARSCHTSVLCDAFCREWTNSTTMQAAIFTKAKTFTSGKARNEESNHGYHRLEMPCTWSSHSIDSHIRKINLRTLFIVHTSPCHSHAIHTSIHKKSYQFCCLDHIYTLFPGCIQIKICYKEISMHRVTIPAFTAKDFDKHTWCNSTFRDQSWSSSFSFFFFVRRKSVLFLSSVAECVTVCIAFWYRCYSINIFLCHICKFNKCQCWSPRIFHCISLGLVYQ